MAFKNPLSGGFSLTRLTPRSRGALFFNLGLVLLIGIVWWMILKPELMPETTTMPSASDSVAQDTPAPAPAQPAPDPQPTPSGETYTVASGDTLASIGTKLGVEWQKIADANGLKEPYDLQIGQVLKIPR